MLGKKDPVEGSSWKRSGRWLRLGLSAVLLLLVLFWCVPAAAASSSSGATSLKIYKGNDQAAEPFHAGNMFPGDQVSKTYNVTVAYSGNINLRFHADIHPGYEKLAEVLCCTIRIDGRTAYDGLMRDMPRQLSHRMYASGSTRETVPYEITVYLDTSVGNAYMNQELMADFRWWVEEKQQLTENPQTGDVMVGVGGLALSSTLLLLLLLWKRKKEEAGNAGE